MKINKKILGIIVSAIIIIMIIIMIFIFAPNNKSNKKVLVFSSPYTQIGNMQLSKKNIEIEDDFIYVDNKGNERKSVSYIEDNVIKKGYINYDEEPKKNFFKKFEFINKKIKILNETQYKLKVYNKLEKVKYISSNKNIVSINEDGIINTKKAGTVKIIAKNLKGEILDICEIIVISNKIDKISFNVETIYLKKSENTKLILNVEPEYITDYKIKFENSDSSIVKIDEDGNVIALNSGTAIITAKVDEFVCDINIIVLDDAENDVLIKKIILDNNKIKIKVGETKALSYSVEPKNVDEKLIFRSDNSNIATVDSKGKIKGINTGTTTIRVSNSSGSIIQNCTITVVKDEISKVKVDNISLNKKNISLQVGDEKYTLLKATISPENAYNKNVYWISDNSKIVSVDSNGHLIAKKVGIATITAIAEDGNKTTSVKVIVTESVTTIKLNKTELNLETNGYNKEKLIATISPNGATDNNVKWTSSNPSVATVNEYGEVTALNNGTTIVTATTVDGNKTASTTVKVTTKLLGIMANSKTITLETNGKNTDKININFSPNTATNKNIKYKSENENIVKVDSKGNVTAISNGNTNVVITTDNSLMIKVKVNVITKIEKFSFDKENIELYVNENNSDKLNLDIYPLNATVDGISWSSSDDSVVTVDSNGNIRAISNGTAKITASSIDGSIYTSTNVNVKTKLKGISLNTKKIELATNGTKLYNLSPTFIPSSASNKEVYYSSNNKSVATVTNKGVIEAKNVGTARITVTSVDGNYTDYLDVNVTVIDKTIHVSSIKINESNVSLVKNGTNIKRLSTTIIPSNADNKSVIWTSSNTSVATVDNNGIVTGVGNGTTTITVKTVDGNKTSSITVNVSTVAKEIIVNTSNVVLDLSRNESKVINISSSPAGSSLNNVTWKSSNSNVVSLTKVSQQAFSIKAVSLGTTTVIIEDKNANLSKTINVKVFDGSATISLNKSNLTLIANNSNKNEEKLIASISSSDTFNTTWKSDNKSVATVDSSGNVTAIGKGQTTIRVSTTLANNTVISASAMVTVKFEVKAITNVPVIIELKKSVSYDTTNFIVSPQEARDSVIMQTSDPNIFDITNDGKLNFKTPGTANLVISAGDYKKTVTVNTISCKPQANLHFIGTSSESILLEDIDDKCNTKYGLIDTGNNETNIVTYLQSLGVKELEFLLVTHNHEDHVDAIKALKPNFKINKVYKKEYKGRDVQNALVKNSYECLKNKDDVSSNIKEKNLALYGSGSKFYCNKNYYNENQNYIEGQRTRDNEFGEGFVKIEEVGDGYKIEFGKFGVTLYNTKNIFDDTNNNYKYTENANSIVAYVYARNPAGSPIGRRALLTGDLDTDKLYKIVTEDLKDRPVDIYKAFHHGLGSPGTYYNNSISKLQIEDMIKPKEDSNTKTILKDKNYCLVGNEEPSKPNQYGTQHEMLSGKCSTIDWNRTKTGYRSFIYYMYDTSSDKIKSNVCAGVTDCDWFESETHYYSPKYRK